MGEEKIVITPKDIPKKVEEEEESSDEEEEEEEKPAPKKLSVADLKPAVQIKVAAPEEKKPMRRPKRQETVEESFLDSAPVEKAKVKDEFDEKDKKPKPEEEKIIITPAVLPEKAPEPPKVVEEPPKVEEEPDLGPKHKVKDEFAEKEKKAKEEAEKIIITPKELPKKIEEEEESSEEEEEEEEKPAPKKLSVADLKPAVQIKVAAPEEKKPMRRPKRQKTEA